MYNSFTRWLLKQKGRSDPIGALAKEVADDEHWPRGQDVGVYCAYIGSYGAGAEAQQVVKYAWSEWSSTEQKKKVSQKRKSAKAARKKNR